MRNVNLKLINAGPDVPSESVERLTNESDPREVKEWAKTADTMVLFCVSTRSHAWKPTMASKIRGGQRETWTCIRCKSEKDVYYNRVGDVVHTSGIYHSKKYPTIPGRKGPESKRALRQERLRRSVEEFADWEYVDA